MNSTVVAVSDRSYFPGVLLLVLSLRYWQVRSFVHVLGVDLTSSQIRALEQLPDTRVFPALTDDRRTPAARKGEAILTARDSGTPWITLLDADCVVTGDITPYLTPPEPAFYARLKSDSEDRAVFSKRYDEADRDQPSHPVLPRRIMEVWCEDVAGNHICAIRNTCCGGNLTLHRRYLGFVEHWQSQIEKVLPDEPSRPHNWDYFAYFQTDESVLNSLLAYASDAPPVRRGQLDWDPEARVAHLGPNRPKPWICWRGDRIKYLPLVFDIVRWARQTGYDLPELPWTYRAEFKPAIYAATLALESCRRTRMAGHSLVEKIVGR